MEMKNHDFIAIMIYNSKIFILLYFRSILMNAADSDSDIRSPTSLDTIQIGDKGETIKLPTKKVLICDILYVHP